MIGVQRSPRYEWRHEQPNYPCRRAGGLAASPTPRPIRSAARRRAQGRSGPRRGSTPSAGPIVVALDRGRAPLTTANFLAYVDRKGFDGESFYRAMPLRRRRADPGRGAHRRAQAPAGRSRMSRPRRPASGMSPGRSRWPMPGPGTAQSDFFILTTDIPAFDAELRRLRPGRRGDGRGEGDPRRAGVADQGRRRDEGPDARAGGEDLEGGATRGLGRSYGPKFTKVPG